MGASLGGPGVRREDMAGDSKRAMVQVRTANTQHLACQVTDLRVYTCTILDVVVIVLVGHEDFLES